MTPDLLWMAPEHLRVYPSLTASKPGDIYSFAIIMYEVCTRTEPYITEPWYISIQGNFQFRFLANFTIVALFSSPE